MSAIFQDLNSRQEYRSNFSFYILQNVFFLVDVRKKSKDFLSSVLLLRSDHCLKSYKSALSDGMIRLNNARLMKPEKKTSNAIWLFKLTSRNAAREIHQVRPELLKIFQPSYASRTIQQGEVPRVAYFWKRWFPMTFCQAAHFTTKNPINKPAKNNKIILIAAVFHFVDPVQKTVKP